MESQASVERKYTQLLKDVETKDFYKIDLSKRVNCYLCKCGHITKTRDIHAGVTPMMFACEICGNDAMSSFYNDIAPQQQPTFEWYRPELKKVLKMRKNPAMLDHILRGGLDYRKIV